MIADTVNGGQLDKRFDDFLYHHLLLYFFYESPPPPIFYFFKDPRPSYFLHTEREKEREGIRLFG